jgi:hypothetical protein
MKVLVNDNEYIIPENILCESSLLMGLIDDLGDNDKVIELKLPFNCINEEFEEILDRSKWCNLKSIGSLLIAIWLGIETDTSIKYGDKKFPLNVPLQKIKLTKDCKLLCRHNGGLDFINIDSESYAYWKIAVREYQIKSDTVIFDEKMFIKQNKLILVDIAGGVWKLACRFNLSLDPDILNLDARQIELLCDTEQMNSLKDSYVFVNWYQKLMMSVNLNDYMENMALTMNPDIIYDRFKVIISLMRLSIMLMTGSNKYYWMNDAKKPIDIYKLKYKQGFE